MAPPTGGIFTPEHIAKQNQQQEAIRAMREQAQRQVQQMMLNCAGNVLVQMASKLDPATMSKEQMESYPSKLAEFSHRCAVEMFLKAGVIGPVPPAPPEGEPSPAAS